MDYKNFYENIAEAHLRLLNTIVLYDGDPHYIHTICEHTDGVFRVYMSPANAMGKGVSIAALNNYTPGTPPQAQALDAIVDGKSPCAIPIFRKKMDSPKFNKFRPFPLGMLNRGGGAVYVERQPLKPNTKQGLIPQMISAHEVTTGFTPGKASISLYSDEFRDCVRGDYPTPRDCLNGLTSGKNMNEAAAFNRNFALVKGPIDTMFLAYKSDVVGVLPHNDFSAVKLGREYGHLKEVTEELRLFTRIS